MKKPTIALVGRPNVGKSTLFNRLIGHNKAITSDIAGTTRDQIIGNFQWDGQSYRLIDMGGLEFITKGSEIEEGMQEQARNAIAEADIIFFMVDAQARITAEDQRAADVLRKSGLPILLVVNKADSKQMYQEALEFARLGFDPLPISTTQGRGIDDVLDEANVIVKPELSSVDEDSELSMEDSESSEGDSVPSTQRSEIINLAIVGKPNVGKSSLLNSILGQNKAIVSDVAGTTRDPVDTLFEYKGKQINLVDTAGIRRRGKVGKEQLEFYSVVRAKRAIERADICVLVIDAKLGVKNQDQHVIQEVLDAKRGLILVVNKWDLVEKDDKTMPRFIRYLQRKLDYVPWAPLVFTSAKTNQRVQNILDLVLSSYEEQHRRISTAELNECIQRAKIKHPPAGTGKKGKFPKIFYTTQTDQNPPTFTVFVNEPKIFHFSYPRYLERQIRDQFGFNGAAIQIHLKGRDGNVDKKRGRRR